MIQFLFLGVYVGVNVPHTIIIMNFHVPACISIVLRDESNIRVALLRVSDISEVLSDVGDTSEYYE